MRDELLLSLDHHPPQSLEVNRLLPVCLLRWAIGTTMPCGAPISMRNAALAVFGKRHLPRKGFDIS